MSGMIAVVLSIAVTVVCWGAYGPVLHRGQDAMFHSSLRPFICVGLAYFLIGVLAPGGYLWSQGERGRWSMMGTFWSLAAGAAGALGALGIIMAFFFNGRPVFVMPLVFGGAPVINSLLTMYWTKSFRKASPIFVAGLILVITGAVTVLVSKPRPPATHSAVAATQWPMVLLSIAVAIVCWGAYGPVLHKGQMKMEGSRLRPLICVGLAYFVIAVVIPGLMLVAGIEATQGEQTLRFTTTGTLWSLAAGGAGAIGALGIIMAFNSGGKPIYVMPLVFGGAPVVNTMITVVGSGLLGEVSPIFYAGLIVTIVGAVTVLIFAPRSHATPPSQKPDQQAVPESAR
jgi:hypothetical protein